MMASAPDFLFKIFNFIQPHQRYCFLKQQATAQHKQGLPLPLPHFHLLFFIPFSSSSSTLSQTLLTTPKYFTNSPRHPTVIAIMPSTNTGSFPVPIRTTPTQENTFETSPAYSTTSHHTVEGVNLMKAKSKDQPSTTKSLSSSAPVSSTDVSAVVSEPASESGDVEMDIDMAKTIEFVPLTSKLHNPPPSLYLRLKRTNSSQTALSTTPILR